MISQPQNPITGRNRIPCLVCVIKRRRTQCAYQIIPPISCEISQDAEPSARNKSYLLARMRYHKTQNPMPATNRIPCLVLTSQNAEPNARNQLYPLSLMGYTETQNPMPVANSTPCLVCDITRLRTQCP